MDVVDVDVGWPLVVDIHIFSNIRFFSFFYFYYLSSLFLFLNFFLAFWWPTRVALTTIGRPGLGKGQP